MNLTPISAERIREVREQTGMGIIEARRLLEKEDLLRAAQTAKTVAELREVVEHLVRRLL